MSIILITILTLFLIKLLRDSLYFAWLWQIKEYRIDRTRSYLREDKSIFKNNIFYLVASFLILFFYLSQQIFIYLALLFFAFTFYQILREIKNRSLKRPKLTFRMLVTFLMIVVFCLIIVFPWIPASAGMTKSSVLILLFLFLYLITPFLITAIILSTNPFFNFQKKRIIKKASLKMRGLKKIKVIGITGSYGKTSTKEFLYAILSQKYKVVKTTGNNNTNIGVAYTVLNKVSDEYDYFICEMGAYKIGEIKEMCEIVKPEIGILTGINEQHLSLFGSIENTRKAKFELVESLPKDGMAIINSRIDIRSEGFSPIVKFFRAEALAPSIKVYQDCVEFDYKNYKFKANLLGKHYIENILSAIITAESLGMNLEEISKAVEKIKPSKFMMRKLDGPNNSVFIDDSYSANPDGVIAALDYLDEAYRDYKKIIVFPGIIELGSSSKKIHQKLFNKIDKICDFAYILNTEYQILNTKNKFIFERDFGKAAEMLKNNLDEKTVVLFESRGAGVVMEKIKK
ncbi:MAG: UDP-N-acetylmuramoyl-tripeptide--D-alanyl-D-alanine ligase [Candidatus Pacebacteria bacterium]|nr:UDP-N-acetylmuramoyl-tripeptide--D-alanyl-D-alanine ligase [Candidatus Paceibacterota bacterium]